MIAIEKLISLILKIVAFVVIVLIIFLLARNIYGNFALYFKKSEILEKYQPNTDAILRNIEDCEKIDDYECFCEVFPNFPATLPNQIKIKFDISEENKNTNITLYYGKNEKDVIDWRKIDGIFSVYDLVKYNKETEHIINYKLLNMEFNKYEGYPKIKGKIDNFEIGNIIISKYLLKKKQEQKNYFLIIGISEDKLRDCKINFKNLIEKIDSPKVQCVNERYKSIQFLNNLKDNLEKKNNINELEIDIGEEFYIEIDKNIALLYRNKEIVEELKYKASEIDCYRIYKERGMKINFYIVEFSKEPVKFELKNNILCEDKGEKITEKITLHKKDRIKIKNGCIEKIVKNREI